MLRPTELTAPHPGAEDQRAMSISDWARVVTASVVPVVMISACGLLCLAFYNRLAAIVGRLRCFQRERLHEQELLKRDWGDGDDIDTHRKVLELLETQTTRVMRRARLIRATLQFLLLAIALLIACSMLLGLSVVWADAMYPAVIFFLAGLLSMFGAMMAAMMELASALEPAELESRFVSEIVHQDAVDAPVDARAADAD